MDAVSRASVVELPPRACTTRARLAAICDAAEYGERRAEASGVALGRARLLLTPPYRGALLVSGVLDDRGALLGFGRLAFTPGAGVAHLELVVRPAWRGRGIGRALLDYASARAARYGLVLVVEGRPSAAALRLASSARLVAARREIRCVRDAAPPEPGACVPPGCVTLAWRDRCPVSLLDAYGRIVALVQEEDMPIAPAEIRYHERATRAAGLRCHGVALLDAVSGALLATSCARVVAGHVAEQAETVVLPAYRGRGLGRAVKTALLRAVCRAEPRLRGFETYTARDNVAMRAVNERLGFVPVDEHVVWCSAA
jgi:GNAT superfamily N-acetyltransferase